MFSKNCETLVHALDAELHLAQKGTTTESCNPYSSTDGKTIENCPTKCQGNDEFKIYYAKNTYSTILDYYDSETYYNSSYSYYGSISKFWTSYCSN